MGLQDKYLKISFLSALNQKGQDFKFLLNELNEQSYETAIDELRNTAFDKAEIRKGALKYYSLKNGVEKYYSVYKKVLNIA